MKFGLIHLADVIKALWTIYANISKIFPMIWMLESPYYTILTEIMKITKLDPVDYISLGSFLGFFFSVKHLLSTTDASSWRFWFIKQGVWLRGFVLK